MKKNDKNSGKSKQSYSFDVGGELGSIRLIRDDVPRYELRVDREGRWFHEGVEIVREDIRNLFSRNLFRCEEGRYCVRIGRDEFPVTVEDAPFLVMRVIPEDFTSARREKPRRLFLLLNDGAEEPLDPKTLMFRESNIPYCLVRDKLEARFSRPAYYQLAKYIEYEPTGDKYLLKLRDEEFEIAANIGGGQ